MEGVLVIQQWSLSPQNPTSSIFEPVMTYDCPAIEIGSPAVTSSGARTETNEVWTSMKGTDNSWCFPFDLFVSLCRFTQHALINVNPHKFSHTKETKWGKKTQTNCKACAPLLALQTCVQSCWVPYCSGHKATCPPQSDLSFFLQLPMGTLLTTAEPTALTPPATALTPPFTSPTPIPGTAATVLTALLVRFRLFPPTQATPPTVIPTAPLVTPYKPPASLPSMPGCVCGWSLLLSEHIKSRMSTHYLKNVGLLKDKKTNNSKQKSKFCYNKLILHNYFLFFFLQCISQQPLAIEIIHHLLFLILKSHSPFWCHTVMIMLLLLAS